MDSRYVHDVKTVEQNALFTGIFILFGMIGLAFTAVFFAGGCRGWALVSLLVTVLCAVALGGFDKKAKREEKTPGAPYELTLSGVYDDSALQEKLFSLPACREKAEIDPVAVCTVDVGLKIRFLLWGCENFDKKEFDRVRETANREFNRKSGVSGRLSIAEAGRRIRVNIVVTKQENEALMQLLSHNAARYLSRAEGVVTVCVNGDKLLVPPVAGNPGYPELMRFKKAIDYLVSSL